MIPAVNLLGLEGRMLVLASTSPRRMELLSTLGIVYQVAPVAVDESIEAGESAESACIRLARAKAMAAPTNDASVWVLGADTLVTVEEHILGKPRDNADAARMLQQLSGRWHEVWTGLALRRLSDGRLFSAAESTRVWFDELPDTAIDCLVWDGGDKAGAYGIQGLAGLFVSRIEGDYYNVMGLPLARLRRLCMEAS